MALSHSSSADSISDVHGPGADDTHNVSQWREVLPGDEIPFEFEAREKLRHRYRLTHTTRNRSLVRLVSLISLPPALQTHSRAEAPPAAGAGVWMGAGEAGVCGQSGRLLPLRGGGQNQLFQHGELEPEITW